MVHTIIDKNTRACEQQLKLYLLQYQFIKSSNHIYKNKNIQFDQVNGSAAWSVELGKELSCRWIYVHFCVKKLFAGKKYSLELRKVNCVNYM